MKSMILIKCDDGKVYRVRATSIAKDDIFNIQHSGEPLVVLRITQVFQNCFDRYDENTDKMVLVVNDIEATAEYVS